MSAVRKALSSTFHRGALLAAALLGASPASADAVSVSDSGSGRVQVEVHDASLGQVLAALHESHFIEFSASDPLSRTVTGTYTGTLSHVLSRLLEGYNYFLHVTASGTELHVVNVASTDTKAALQHEISSNADAAAAPAAAAPVAAAPAPPPIRLSVQDLASKAQARAQERARARARAQ